MGSFMFSEKTIRSMVIMSQHSKAWEFEFWRGHRQLFWVYQGEACISDGHMCIEYVELTSIPYHTCALYDGREWYIFLNRYPANWSTLDSW